LLQPLPDCGQRRIVIAHDPISPHSGAASDYANPTSPSLKRSRAGVGGQLSEPHRAAQYVTLPAAHLAARPRSVPHAETATLPPAALTAWQALVDHAALKPGERVLVQGGAGGAGSHAVQLAALLGGSVTATGRAVQREFVLGLGARAFLATDAEQRPGGFDVVIDTVGGAALDASYAMTRRGGRLVTLAAPPDQEKAAELGVHATFFVVTPDAAELARLAALVDAGRLRPVLSQTFPLRDGRAAFESASRPRPPGKTVLIVR
jgi:NADPH:quinone reductase-like Zn-dependent oxidoreductase